MARARSPNSIEAERLYHNGMKLVDIAKKFGVPDGTVRRWKSTQKWDENKSEQSKKKESERSVKKKTSVRKPRGAPKGNKNAVGHSPSVPRGNKNAEKHGAYSTIYTGVFNDDEIALMQEVPDSEEEVLKQQIGSYSVRERYLIQKIREFESKLSKGLYVKEVRTSKHSDYVEGKATPKSVDTYTKTEHWINGLTALESELTKVQRAKTKCIDSLIRLRQINERYDDMLNGWKTKVTEEASINKDKKTEDVHIYIPDNGRNDK